MPDAHTITYGVGEVTSASIPIRPLRKALAIAERRGVHAAHQETGVPRGLLRYFLHEADAAPSDGCERLTTTEVLERFPAISAYYKRPRRALSAAAERQGAITRISHGPGHDAEYVIDSRFREWVRGLED